MQHAMIKNNNLCFLRFLNVHVHSLRIMHEPFSGISCGVGGVGGNLTLFFSIHSVLVVHYFISL